MADALGGPQPDGYLLSCVVCGGVAVAVGIAFGEDRGGVKADFCAECIAEGRDLDNFGRCYQCRHFHDHEECIGVPCQCPCPTPDQRARTLEREAALMKLTPYERQILGY